MMPMEYRIVLTPGRGAIQVSFPEFPEAQTSGKTEADATARALEALATVIASYIRNRRPLPAPKPRGTRHRSLHLPAILAAKIDLYRALVAAKLTKYALAKKLGWHVPQVDRLFDVRHHSRLDQIEEAARALGKRVRIRVS